MSTQVIETFERTKPFTRKQKADPKSQFVTLCSPHCWHDSHDFTYCCHCEPLIHRQARRKLRAGNRTPTLDELIAAHYVKHAKDLEAHG